MNIKAAAIFLIAALSACDISPSEAQRRNRRAVHIQEDGRFAVKRVAVIVDDLAYDNERGIYLIQDSKTGKEFVGISGIGISELGTHPSGKTRLTDER